MELNLLAITVLGLGGGLVGLLGVLRRHWTKSRWYRLATLAVVLTAAVLAVFGEQPWQALIPISLLVALALLHMAVALERFVRRVGGALRRPGVVGGFLLVVSPLLAVAWSHVAGADPEFWELPPPEESVTDIARVEVPHVNVWSDTGRSLTVSKPARPATSEEVKKLQQKMVLANVVCTDAPGADYNCHGWVFTDGKYWIHGTQVRGILEDNGYRRVADPRAGDIIVYWSGAKVVHTGIVRAVKAGKVIVESKWGMQGRFIHEAANQDYSQEFAYYRSEREGHLLLGIGDDVKQVARAESSVN